MVVRHGLLLIFAASSGCALVSGLANLDVDGGAASDASLDGVVVDAMSGSDAADSGTVADATDASPNRAMTALQTKGVCSKTSNNVFPFSGEEFTIGLWLRLDSSNAQLGAAAILWKGGQTASVGGWSFLVQSSNITFCASDGNGQTCTPPFALVMQHEVHIVLVSALTGTSGRTLAIYARDQSAGDASHMLVASAPSAPTTWTATMPFTVGGISQGVGCLNASSVTIDDLRVYDVAEPIALFDANDTIDISCSAQGLAGDFAFNEGKGTTAGDCTKNNYSLALGSGATFIPSPFP